MCERGGSCGRRLRAKPPAVSRNLIIATVQSRCDSGVRCRDRLEDPTSGSGTGCSEHTSFCSGHSAGTRGEQRWLTLVLANSLALGCPAAAVADSSHSKDCSCSGLVSLCPGLSFLQASLSPGHLPCISSRAPLSCTLHSSFQPFLLRVCPSGLSSKGSQSLFLDSNTVDALADFSQLNCMQVAFCHWQPARYRLHERIGSCNILRHTLGPFHVSNL